MGRALIRAVLIARCVVSVVFAARLGVVSASSNLALVNPFVWFATVDGLLALAMGGLALTVPVLHGSFILVAAIDGLLLLGAALTLRLAPGIPFYVVTTVLYIGLAGVIALVIGLLKIIVARRLERAMGGNALSGALAVAGFASIAFGAAAFFMHPEPTTVRLLLIAGALMEGLALLVAALRPWNTAPLPIDTPSADGRRP
jgi:hypothetical protein